MQRIMSSFIALAFVAMLPAAGLAQTGSPSDRGTSPGAGGDRRGGTSGTTERSTTNRGAADSTKRDRPTWNNTQGLHETGNIIGTAVEGPDGKNLGKVDALLIEPKDGKVTHAVVGMGGMLGIGEEKVVVPYTALEMSGHEGGRKAKVTIDQAALDSAPKYVRAAEPAPSASPATTSGSSGGSGDPTKRDADGRPLGDKPATGTSSGKK